MPRERRSRAVLSPSAVSDLAFPPGAVRCAGDDAASDGEPCIIAPGAAGSGCAWGRREKTSVQRSRKLKPKTAQQMTSPSVLERMPILKRTSIAISVFGYARCTMCIATATRGDPRKFIPR